MIDQYHLNDIIRFRRSRAYPENKVTSFEIKWIEDQVKDMNLMGRCYFKDEERRQLNQYKHEIFPTLTLKLRLDISNCAYENTLKHNQQYKDKPVLGFIKYLLKKPIW